MGIYPQSMNETSYEYDFVRLKLRGGAFSGKFDQDYQEIIKERARVGWRFVQCFAPAIVGYGASSYVDLIFERPAAS